jgi:hypothetical protein
VVVRKILDHTPREVEARVVKALQENLLRQDLCEELCDEFTGEMNRLRMGLAPS